MNGRRRFNRKTHPKGWATQPRASFDDDLVAEARQWLDDPVSRFASGHNSFASSWKDRYVAGYKAFAEFAKRKRLSTDRTLKFIAHSQGSAYAEGMAQAALEARYEVEVMIHFSPYQALLSGDCQANVSESRRVSVTSMFDFPLTNHRVPHGQRTMGLSHEVSFMNVLFPTLGMFQTHSEIKSVRNLRSAILMLPPIPSVYYRSMKEGVR